MSLQLPTSTESQAKIRLWILTGSSGLLGVMALWPRFPRPKFIIHKISLSLVAIILRPTKPKKYLQLKLKKSPNVITYSQTEDSNIEGGVADDQKGQTDHQREDGKEQEVGSNGRPVPEVSPPVNGVLFVPSSSLSRRTGGDIMRSS